MSNKSNDNGRAYEYACLNSLLSEIRRIRKVKIEVNSSYFADEKAWLSLGKQQQSILTRSADAACKEILKIEPLILENSNDELVLTIQNDEQGKIGDVRDILIIRRKILWEIGLSIKHNNESAKHNRLSEHIDFGDKWYGYPCSEDYWLKVNPVFNFLKEQKKFGKKWSDMPNKTNAVYIPMLDAFISEIKRANAAIANLPQKLVEYLIGEYDFYKVISLDADRKTKIQPYNLHGGLTKQSVSKTTNSLPIVMPPRQINGLGYKPGSKTTIEIYMDRGWQLTLRIHNASTIVEPSLKFDIKLLGTPITITENEVVVSW